MASRAKNLGLVSVILGASVSSGCVPLAIAALYEHERLANGIHRQADAMEGNRRSFGQVHDLNATHGEVFTCTHYEDQDNDGKIHIGSEVWNKGKTDFFVGDKVFFAASVTNGIGRKIVYFSQNKSGDIPTKYNEGIVDIPNKVYWVGPVQLNAPAVWNSYWTLDGEKIGEHKITVRERVTNSITQR
ncbi:MAG: hypothetical protein AABX10_01255 [Nanoarchaeota archaeon]